MTAMASDPSLGGGLSQRDFRRLGGFISEVSGIKMPPAKRAMVEGRLRRRLRSLGMADFGAYCRYLFDEGGLEREGVHIIDAVTTNKTEFFREPEHFQVLARTAVPALAAAGRVHPLRVWSAACSTGAEPYTLAMVLEDWAATHGGLEWSVTASDLSTEVLETARLAIYPEDAVAPVPVPLRHRYLLRSRDRARRLVRVDPALRAKVQFLRQNLMDENFAVKGAFEVIFCRNVLIYFDKPTQAAVLSRLCGRLVRGGYLFIGHSETVAGLDLPLRSIAHTVFVKE